MAILFRILRRIGTKICRIHYRPIAMPILWEHENVGVQGGMGLRGAGWAGTEGCRVGWDCKQAYELGALTEHFLSHKHHLYI
jgi:hypothetical protein